MEHRVDKVLARYSLNSNAIATLLQVGTANQSYLIRDGNKFYMLRLRNDNYSSDNWLQYEEQYLGHLFAAGIVVAVPIKNVDGQGWTVIDGKTYQLLPYIRGRKFSGQMSQISSAGVFLGQLHNAVIDFVPNANKNLPRYDNPDTALRMIIDVEEHHRETITIEEKDTLQLMKEQCKEISVFVPNEVYNSLPQLVIHGDYHPANVKYMNDSVSSVFDFDWISLQPRLRDILDGVIYFAGIRSSPLNGGDIYSLNQNLMFDHDRSLAFVQAYCATSNLPLTLEEINLIPYFLRSRLIFSRVQALAKIPKEQHIRILTQGIEHSLHWVDINQDKEWC